MKRWQDRGEVLDSDDEDEALDLEAEDEAQRPVKKKARIQDVGTQALADSREDVLATSARGDDAAEAGWLQPKLANTYGRRTRFTKATAQESARTSALQETPEETGSDDPFLAPAPEEAGSSPLQHEHSSPAASAEQDSETVFPASNVSAALHAPDSSETAPTEQQRIPVEVPPSSDRDILPDVQDLWTGGNGVSELGRPQSNGNVSSGLSSPLSERSISPPAPSPIFRFPRPALDHTEIRSRDVSSSFAERRQMSATPDDIDEALRHGGRTFRVRKAQQLHPYEYEKLQYQKQFRDRGLRPVKVTLPERHTAEAQEDSSSDGDPDNWQPSQQARSSHARASSEIGEAATALSAKDSDDELPDIASIGRRTAFAVVQRGPNQQKLSHHQAETSRHFRAGSQPLDDFSIPPSPPPTSSESSDNRDTTARPAVFRFPRGMTPNRHTQQPTPNVSSDVRHTQLDSDDDDPQRSRMSTVTRPRHAPIPIDSSTDSSASGPASDDDPDVRRLLRERKRIRGVLPASWLKIDLQAQQRRSSPSLGKRREPYSASPEKALPQKGVAQRIASRAPGPATQRAPIPISDDESDNDLSGSLSASKKRQLRLDFNRDPKSTAPTDFADDDPMEVDHVDAMLAGTSRPRSRKTSSKARQPRITDAFTASRDQRMDFAEERRAARRARGASSRRSKSGRQRLGGGQRRKSSAPLLSIVDAPSPSSPSSEPFPQFVKLAMRVARTQLDHGRHSPTQKHIRLATDRDTEEATSVLQAWRAGTVAPRRQPAPRTQHERAGPVAEDAIDQADTEHDGPRLPLTELSANQQTRLPKALRITTAKPQAGAKRLNLSTKLRQSRMDPVVFEHRASPERHEPGAGEGSSAIHSGSRKQKPTPRHRVPQPRYHDAQVETLESDFDRGHRAAAFERRMQVLTENVVRGRSGQTPVAPVQLERFLHDPDNTQSEASDRRRTSSQSKPQHQHKQSGAPSERPRPLPHRPRKRIARRLDTEARQYRQPSEPLLIDLELEQASSWSVLVDAPTLQGLGPFGTRYALDFDTLPLPLGTYFHESSFIGSGDFAASLHFAGRNLDISTGRIRIQVDGEVLDLGIWNEEVAAGLVKIPLAVSDALQSLGNDAEVQGSQDSLQVIFANIEYLLRSTIRYFTRCLAFSDPIDRRACVQCLHMLVEDTIEAAIEVSSASAAKRDIQARCLQYAAVLARQTLNLCDHPTIPSALSQQSRQLFQKATNRLANHFVHALLPELRYFYEDIRRAAKREAGIRDTDSAICSVTILHQVLRGYENTPSSFWAALHLAMDTKIESLTSVTGFDRLWCNLFAVLPALEIDSHGILQLGSRLADAKEDWSLCRALVERLFQLYPATCTLSGSTINDYVRATLTRCSRLQSRWGWSRCEPMLYCISDFFARRSLAQLYKEESRGSPRFLQALDQHPSLEIDADDRSFHIFLKVLASGLLDMRNRGVYPDKKIGGIAWRFIPNHGRTHRKDADVRQEDLDALRNHHDLLSTIYYASPPNRRLRVDLIQNLVDHAASHREACRLNVRAWCNLATFQASTTEPVERLAPFHSWFQELLDANILQFHLARTEVERDAASAAVSGQPTVSHDMIESIIAANQRQIAATITDALAAVKQVVRCASSLDVASAIVAGTTFWHAFDLFDPTARKLFGLFLEGLEVVKTALEVQKKLQSDEGSQLASDDSQDYGDSMALQELASTQAPPFSGSDMLEILHTPVAGFLSSVFGAESTADDGLLAKVVDVWVQLAGQAVSQGKKMWHAYISGYGSEAWSQLRDTAQRRKYTPYFLARVVEAGDVDPVETGILTFWLKSMVEREATLKFQHTLTNALLSRKHSEPLLSNLPFIRPRNGQFAVSLHELRRSRLGLVSSVLSNMHQHFDEMMSRHPATLQELRRTYADMLRQMMQAMKANYQEVQVSNDGNSADPRAQGEYVGFVQQVVSFLQQYTTDICAIDRFFTDSSAFPLPATDPTYVVGRLKGYIPKLSASSRRKELSVFVQTVSERAAVDGKQIYLVDQLTAAMTGVLERGDPRAPSLRHVLMTAILPAYVENALSGACSWILALPVIQACGRTIPDLLYSVRMEDEASVQAAVETLAAPVHCMLGAIETALAYPGQLTLSHVLAVLSAIYDAARQSLTVMHHLARTRSSRYLLNASRHFDQCAFAIESVLTGNEDADFPERRPNDPDVRCHWADTMDFSRRQFQDNMKGWHAREGQYFVCRGTGSVEVVIRLEDEAEEKRQLLEALSAYQQSYDMVFGGWRRETTEVVSAIDEVVV